VSAGAARELLAVAVEHEQAVVDPQTEAHAADEVQREHRDRRELVDQSQPQKREHDRKAADQQRQQRRDQTSEEPERQQQQKRKGEQLGAREVAGRAFVEFLVGERVAAETHAHPRELRIRRGHREGGADTRDRRGRVGRSGERREHHRFATVARKQCAPTRSDSRLPPIGQNALESVLS